MKKVIAAMALVLAVPLFSARADMKLFAARGTVTPTQAAGFARALEQTLGEPVTAVLQEETGESLSQMIMEDRAPQLAILFAPHLNPLAGEGMLLALDGCMDEVRQIAQPLVDACVYDETLVAVPLFVRRRCMAVNARHMDAAAMGYLLSHRAHPVWYPSEFVQALDELALSGTAGMQVWPPEETDTLWLEALLHGVTGYALFSGEEAGAQIREDMLEDALSWLREMILAGLVKPVKDRAAALSAFLEGRTTVFPDWTEAETALYAQKIREEEIILLPYPSLYGESVHAAELVCVCAIGSEGAEADERTLSAAEAIAGGEGAQRMFDAQAMMERDALWLPALAQRDNGSTLRALFCAAVRETMAGADARAQAQAMMRAALSFGR